MQYSVPQFIDVEDKIVGPFTGKQVLILIIGFGSLLVMFTFMNMVFFIVFSIPIVLGTLLFAFWKPKGFTVSKWITNIMNFYTTPHLYIWRREPEIIMIHQVQKKKSEGDIVVTKVSRNRIKELAWLLDTSTAIEKPYEVKARPDENIR
ncbi:PrgI family protein [Patescibacteria group bacterium]|nr:PrgI family protein [Patescibacteria group bacterium]